MSEVSGASSILPHRAYRRLAERSSLSLVVSALVVATLACVLVWRLGDMLGLVGLLASQLTGAPAAATDRTFLHAALPVLDFDIAPSGYRELVAWIVACVLVILGLGSRKRAPLRLFAQWLALLCGSSALWLLFVGEPPYGPEEFSVLYMSSSASIWVVTILLMGGLSVVFPFNLIERILLVAVCVGYDVVLSGVRYALAVLVLERFGAVPMSALYLLLGPMMDFVVLVGVFALFVIRAGERMDRGALRRGWAWL